MLIVFARVEVGVKLPPSAETTIVALPTERADRRTYKINKSFKK